MHDIDDVGRHSYGPGRQRRAVDQKGEEEGCRYDSDGMQHAEERDDDGGEAVVVRHSLDRPAVDCCDLDATGKAGEGAGDDHCERHIALDADAAVAGRAALGSAGPHLVAEARLPHEEVDEDCQDQGDEDAIVEAPCDASDLDGGRQSGALRRSGARERLGRVEQRDAEAEGVELGRDVVQHDGRQQLADLQLRLQYARDEAPQRTAQHCGQQGQGQDDGLRQVAERQGDRGEAQDAHGHLALGADVDDAAAVGDRDAQRDDAQRDHPDEDLGQVPHPRQRCDDYRVEGAPDVGAQDHQDHRRHQEGRQDGKQYDADLVYQFEVPHH